MLRSFFLRFDDMVLCEAESESKDVKDKHGAIMQEMKQLSSEALSEALSEEEAIMKLREEGVKRRLGNWFKVHPGESLALVFGGLHRFECMENWPQGPRVVRCDSLHDRIRSYVALHL